MCHPATERRPGLLGALVLAVAAASALPAAPPLQPPSGPGALAPGLATDPVDGSVLLTWLEPDGTGHVLRFSRFDGARFAPPRQIARGEDWFANWADTPGLSFTGAGVWLAHWLEKSADSPYAYDIRMARSGDRGRSWQPVPSPHRDGTPTEHGFVSRFIEPDGRIGLVWLDGRETATDAEDTAMTLRSASIAPDGRIDDRTLLDSRVCDCCQTASATTSAGPVVAYRDRSGDEIRDISIVRRIDGRWTEPAPVHRDGWRTAGCPVNGPAIIAQGMQVVVAWFTMADDTPVVRVALSQDAGASFSPPQEFSAGRALGRVELAWLGEGYALAWMDQTEDGAGMRLARFDAEARKIDQRTLTTLAGGRISGFPQIAPIAGRLLVVWTDVVENAETGRRTRIRALIHDPAAPAPSGVAAVDSG